MTMEQKIGRSIWFPVMFFSAEREMRDKPLLLGKPHSFWTHWYKEQSVFYHPALLLNAFTSRAEGDKRHDLNIGPDTRVLIDSGGFQLYKQTVIQGKTLNIQPIEILRTQELWGDGPNDAAFIIDYPVGADDNDDMFDFCLKETEKNCQFYQDNMKSNTLRMLNVLHGHTMERIKVWYDLFHKFKYNGRTGWSVGFHPSSDVMNQARMFAFIWSQQTESEPLNYFHFLGVSGWNTMPLLVYASRFCDEVVFDSSSYGAGYKTKTYMVPPDVDRGGDVVFGDQIQSWHELVNPPCNCPVCIVVRDSGKTFPEAMLDSNGGGHLISLHNMFQYIDRSRKLHALVADKERYLKYVKSHCSDEALLAILYLDEVKRSGFEIATREFGRYFKRLHENQLTTTFGSMFQTSGLGKIKEKDAIRKPADPNKQRKRGRKKKGEPESVVGEALAEEKVELVQAPPAELESSSKLSVLDSLPEVEVDPAVLDSDLGKAAMASMFEDSDVIVTSVAVESNSPDIVVPEVQPSAKVLSEFSLSGVTTGRVQTAFPNTSALPREQKQRQKKVKEAPKLLELPELSEVVHLDVIQSKPECYGQFEAEVCDGSFCGQWLQPCSQDTKKEDK
jgi:queuine/archaeosine tRNA-ribosyltransferase